MTLRTDTILNIYTKLGKTPGPIENRQNEEAVQLLIAYNNLNDDITHKLSVVQFGNTWVGVAFDPRKSSWYNPNNVYPNCTTFYDAVLAALAIRLNILRPGSLVQTDESFDPHAR